MKPRNVESLHNFNLIQQKLNMKMRFGFKVRERKGEILLDFKEDVPNWKRFASELLNDRVIMDLENGSKKIEEEGDFIVYEVYNLWKKIDVFKKIYEKARIVGDLTLLNHGIFSTSSKGELFSTYGHAHRNELGELYFVLKNECFLILSDKKTFQTFIVKLKEGDCFLIHPNFMHRLTSYKKDCLILTLAPEEAGHDYDCIKGKGFPFHLFYDKKKRKVEMKKNPNYEASYKMIRKSERIELHKLIKNPEKLRKLLENPILNKKYFNEK